jgi:hypothetical protein
MLVDAATVHAGPGNVLQTSPLRTFSDADEKVHAPPVRTGCTREYKLTDAKVTWTPGSDIAGVGFVYFGPAAAAYGAVGNAVTLSFKTAKTATLAPSDEWVGGDAPFQFHFHVAADPAGTALNGVLDIQSQYIYRDVPLNASW